MICVVSLSLCKSLLGSRGFSLTFAMFSDTLQKKFLMQQGEEEMAQTRSMEMALEEIKAPRLLL